MVRILGIGRKRSLKKRLTPSAQTPEGLRHQHPMFQYAVNEYSQTVASGTSNDDGQMMLQRTNTWSYESTINSPLAPSGLPKVRSMPDGLPRDIESQRVHTPLSLTKNEGSLERNPGASLSESQLSPRNVSNRTTPLPALPSSIDSEMPDATYEEHYGDAYTGDPIKYVYPSGYQSMRPRSCPWKLSVVVCIMFTWLSVFIVGHCSDQVDEDRYENAQIDDDSLAIEVRWCGSRPLYLMWVASMLITGLSAAYCSVIGYIKVRDFAVANSRSQPPGLVDVKSDYYVSITDSSLASSEGSASTYRTTIYQSDGTPQFWGSHIFRPTQAAVAITSR
jgi:hypothetical protein